MTGSAVAYEMTPEEKPADVTTCRKPVEPQWPARTCRPRTKPDPKQPKVWTREMVIGHSKPGCLQCFGLGMLVCDASEPGHPCNCVLRNLFRRALNRFLFLQSGCKSEPSHTDLEYCADFALLAKRTVRRLEQDIFRLHYVGGLDWRACCNKLSINRGEFFHACYRLEAWIGRAMVETEPYAVAPVGEYYSNRVVLPHERPRHRRSVNHTQSWIDRERT